VQLTPVTEAANILVMGDQGSGKSAVIRGWTEQILARGERAIIHGAKGDVLASARSRTFCWSPLTMQGGGRGTSAVT
jgi:GTPase SAR1 family protein